MNRIVWPLTLLLFAVENNSVAPLPRLVQGSTEGSPPSAQGAKIALVKVVTCNGMSGNGIAHTKLAEDNAVKLALYEAVMSPRGIVKLKRIAPPLKETRYQFMQRPKAERSR